MKVSCLFVRLFLIPQCGLSYFLAYLDPAVSKESPSKDCIQFLTLKCQQNRKKRRIILKWNRLYDVIYLIDAIFWCYNFFWEQSNFISPVKIISYIHGLHISISFKHLICILKTCTILFLNLLIYSLRTKGN